MADLASAAMDAFDELTLNGYRRPNPGFAYEDEYKVVNGLTFERPHRSFVHEQGIRVIDQIWVWRRWREIFGTYSRPRRLVAVLWRSNHMAQPGVDVTTDSNRSRNEAVSRGLVLVEHFLDELLDMVRSNHRSVSCLVSSRDDVAHARRDHADESVWCDFNSKCESRIQ